MVSSSQQGARNVAEHVGEAVVGEQCSGAGVKAVRRLDR